MPVDFSRYPADWPDVVAAIRARACDRCECAGECGLHPAVRDEEIGATQPRRCCEANGQPAKYARGKIVLTIAHLNAPGGPCICEPLCGDPAHLKAMCQRCHLRYDAPRHAASAGRTRSRKRRTEDRQAGVQGLFPEESP